MSDLMAESIRINRMLLTLILFLAGQGIAGIVWGTNLTAKVGFLTTEVQSLKATIADGTRLRYTSVDATKDKEIVFLVMDDLKKRTTAIESRILAIEKSLHEDK